MGRARRSLSSSAKKEERSHSQQNTSLWVVRRIKPGVSTICVRNYTSRSYNYITYDMIRVLYTTNMGMFICKRRQRVNQQTQDFIIETLPTIGAIPTKMGTTWNYHEAPCFRSKRARLGYLGQLAVCICVHSVQRTLEALKALKDCL